MKQTDIAIIIAILVALFPLTQLTPSRFSVQPPLAAPSNETEATATTLNASVEATEDAKQWGPSYEEGTEFLSIQKIR